MFEDRQQKKDLFGGKPSPGIGVGIHGVSGESKSYIKLYNKTAFMVSCWQTLHPNYPWWENKVL